MSYISIKVKTDLTPLAEALGLEPVREPHISVFSSADKAIAAEVVGTLPQIPATVTATNWMPLGQNADLVVLTFNVPWLNKAHEVIKDKGYTHVFADYITHVTLGRMEDSPGSPAIKPHLPVVIELEPEYLLESYNADYKST